MQLVDIAYLPEYFTSEELAQQIAKFRNGEEIKMDPSIHIHLLFIRPGIAGYAFGKICAEKNPVAVGSHGGHQPRSEMAFIISHEIGHVLGKKLLLTASTNLPKFLSFFSAYIYIKK